MPISTLFVYYLRSSYLYLNNQHAESITMTDLFTEWTLVAVWSYWQTQSHEIPPASHQITRIVMHGLMTWRTPLLGRFDALICSYLLCTMSVLRATLISPKHKDLSIMEYILCCLCWCILKFKSFLLLKIATVFVAPSPGLFLLCPSMSF